MRLEKALEKGNGRAKKSDINGYAEVVKEQIVWRDNGSDGAWVDARYLFEHDWLPYGTEPCAACKKANELESLHDFGMSYFSPAFVEHLRHYHCTCEKEGL